MLRETRRGSTGIVKITDFGVSGELEDDLEQRNKVTFVPAPSSLQALCKLFRWGRFTTCHPNVWWGSRTNTTPTRRGLGDVILAITAEVEPRSHPYGVHHDALPVP